MLGEKLGHVFDTPLERIAKKISIHPNSITLIGFLITIVASCTLAADLFLGGILIMIGALFDVMDGVVARVNHKSSRFGAFLDSVLDRYSDGFIFLALAWYFVDNVNYVGLALSMANLLGSFLVSYSRARAEGLGEKCNVGLMERPERIILISAGAMSGFIVMVLWILAVLTNITVLQRIYHVWERMEKDSI